MRSILLLILAGNIAWGNACTTTGTGTNWSSTSHWTACGGTTPQPGDTVTIANATTVDVSATIGTSPVSGGTAALVINAALTVATGVELRVRGPVTQGNTGITFSAGSTFTFDSSLAASPSTTTYAWTSNGYSRGNRLITFAGTAGSHVTIRSDAGGGHGYFFAASGYGDSLAWDANYTDFQRIGDATNEAVNMNTFTDAFVNKVLFCTFDASSGVVRLPYSSGGAGGWRVEDSRFLQTNVPHNGGLNSDPGVYFGTTGLTSSGIHTAYRNVFANVVIIGMTGMDLIDNVFLKSWQTSGYVGFWTNMTGSFTPHYDTAKWNGSTSDSFFLINPYDAVLSSGTATGAASTTLSDTGKAWTANQYYNCCMVEIMSGAGVGQRRLITANTATQLTVAYRWDVTPNATSTYQIRQDWINPHILDSNVSPTGVSMTADGLVFQNSGTDWNGDCILHMDTNSNTYNIIHLLVLPNGMGENSCTPATLGSTNAAHYNLEKSTWHSGSQTFAISEQSAGVAGIVTKFKSNIAWADPARTYAGTLGPYLETSVMTPSGDTTDVIAAGAADYNATWGVRDGYARTTLFPSVAGRGYNSKFSTAPGTHDVYGDPGFVDPTRNFQSWAVSRGSTAVSVTGQIADGIAYLAADPTLTRTSLLPYIRAGFAPTNAAYKNAGYDGGDIGAVSVSSAAQPRRVPRKVSYQ